MNCTIAGSADAAVARFAQATGAAQYIAGGTTLYDLMKLGIEQLAHPIDISRIDGLDIIENQTYVPRFGGAVLIVEVARCVSRNGLCGTAGSFAVTLLTDVSLSALARNILTLLLVVKAVVALTFQLRHSDMLGWKVILR
ncbi:FAD binding domain-containing protein [Rhizobium leguminosarum]|uniref:FAD binding domain-containing protein n=1 Tax=Rhizobium leguminosarum TaxID=384 RepID=UPI0021BBF953|nr:FAD binding domain-containing protein [Rhizobium leguminosarum]